MKQFQANSYLLCALGQNAIKDAWIAASVLNVRSKSFYLSLLGCGILV
jgi:hypothetical protein